MRSHGEMTVEEYDAWYREIEENEALLEAAGEEGGPRVSLVPEPVSLPYVPPPDDPFIQVEGREVAFVPEPSRKRIGWCGLRQRLFVDTLAQTGSVHLAAQGAGLSARSAYALRVRSAPFARAWDAAQSLAVGRLSSIAFDRAIHGRIEQVYNGGDLVSEKRVPSDRLLMWLLARFDPRRFAMPWETRGGDEGPDPQEDARQALPALLDELVDTSDELIRLPAEPETAGSDPRHECEHSEHSR